MLSKFKHLKQLKQWMNRMLRPKDGDQDGHSDDDNAIDTQLNPNEDKRKTMILAGVIIVLAVLAYAGYSFLSPKKVNEEAVKQDNFVKIKDRTFTEEDTTSALSQQQSTIDELQRQLRLLSEKYDSLNKSQNKQQTEFNTQNTALQTQLKEAQEAMEKAIADQAQQPQQTQQKPLVTTAANMQPKGTRLDGSQNNDNALGDPRRYDPTHMAGVIPVMQSFSNPFIQAEHAKQAKLAEGNKYKRTWKNFVPTGTFCRAVLLGGADANAGVDSQGDTSPILFKIENNCILPNGKYSRLKGGFITASVYGRISSERGIVRLDNFSLVRKDGTILDIPVEGTAFDIGGKNGIRGIPVLKNGKIIQMSGLSGLLSGIGGALNQASTTTSVSPLGTTQSIDPSKVAQAGLGQGAQTALSKVAEYYLKLAEQYSPIIQLNAGAMVDIVFLKGFPIEDEKMMQRYENAVNNARMQSQQAANVQTIQIPTNPLMQNIPKPYGQMQANNTPTITPSLSYNQAFNETTQDKLGAY